MRGARGVAHRLLADGLAAELCFREAKQTHRFQRDLPGLACELECRGGARLRFLEFAAAHLHECESVACLRLEGGRLRAIREREHRAGVRGGTREVALRDVAFRAEVEQGESLVGLDARRGQRLAGERDGLRVLSRPREIVNALADGSRLACARLRRAPRVGTLSLLRIRHQPRGLPA